MLSFTNRSYESGDEEKIIELLSIIFDGWPHLKLSYSKKDYWRWKILGAPSGLNQVGLAFNGDQLIGCNHAYYMDIKIGENIYLGRQAVDFGVHPDYFASRKRSGEANV